MDGRAPWWPRRDEAYTGVLVDDLINLGTNEPYRMFTSRAEYRLRLREDNADQRLTPIGRQLGVVGDERWNRFQEKCGKVTALSHRLAGTSVAPDSPLAQALAATTGETVSREVTLLAFLRRPGVSLANLADVLDLQNESPVVINQVEVEAKYEGYIRRQDEEIARVRRHESIELPPDLPFAQIDGLSNELRQKLLEVQPSTLARAARIPGMTPAALSLLLVYARKLQRSNGSKDARARG